MADFSTNTQKLRLTEREFRKMSTNGNNTITWDESITIIQQICTSRSKEPRSINPMLDPTIRQNLIGFLETELHWNPTRKIPWLLQIL
ncbi:unnamed protein product [Adineta ricciae]|uniref:EF-hand domain-containing protein n=1 Tax=Adineta ricciae TaxID=249248 RepID=A0A814QDR0_ADIRI|nr:unnamed protein product [Adineta ricciae]